VVTTILEGAGIPAPAMVNGGTGTLPFTIDWDETFDVGLDTGTTVDDRDYTSPNPFTGRIVRLTIDYGDNTITPAALRLLEQEMARRQPAEN
jgi:hypothetical protein